MTVTVKCVVVSRFATRERPAPPVVDAQAENNHFERVSLLAAGLALCVEHLAEVVEVSPQARVRLGGAHRFEVLVFKFEHVAQLASWVTALGSLSVLVEAFQAVSQYKGSDCIRVARKASKA